MSGQDKPIHKEIIVGVTTGVLTAVILAALGLREGGQGSPPQKVQEAKESYKRGDAWLEKKEYDLAIADYNEAIHLDPRYAAAYYKRGVAWRRKRDYDRAIADANEAIRLDPKDADAYNFRGIAWSAKKEYDREIADYGEAIRLNPKFAAAYNNRGVAWRAKKEYEKSLADCNEAVRLAPKVALAFVNRGVTRRHMKEYDRAIADYNQAIRLDPKCAAAYNSRAWLWATCPDEKYRDGKRAVDSATRACELGDWKNANHLDTLAAAYAEAGDYDKAVEFQEKAHKLYSDEGKKQWGKLLDLYKNKKPYRDEG